ncbi:alpha/beta hydrolase [Butyrivibrio sp. XPD2006]|uniref:alpha/beta hydrolase n=1 Tax=Butyrivibrio sp. XPD2006 TaxID=1280668 RepID=UPI0003B49C41|nr:alpha/beta hydrolase [Butyrivibrio sp. XPD2006]
MIYQEFDIKEKGSLEGAKLTVYIQEYAETLNIKDRPLILICPGGAYAYTSDREAEPIALSFLAKGYHAAVLRYSCAPAVFPTALMELGRSILLIREHAKEWHIKEDSIVVQGCSAGGHLAASYACMWMSDFLSEGMNITYADRIKLRPNGLMLCYPVITSGKFAHEGSIQNLLGDNYLELKEMMSLENAVNEHVPRTFIWHTFTDGAVPVENSLLFATALREHGISTELHIFPEGCHGLALANELTAGNELKEIEPVAEPWIDLATTWMKKY